MHHHHQRNVGEACLVCYSIAKGRDWKLTNTSYFIITSSNLYTALHIIMYSVVPPDTQHTSIQVSPLSAQLHVRSL